MNPYLHHSSFIDERCFVGKAIFDLLHHLLYYKDPSMKELHLLSHVIFGHGIRCFCPVILPKNGHLKSSK